MKNKLLTHKNIEKRIDRPILPPWFVPSRNTGTKVRESIGHEY